ncbi:hypothetical protein [Nevskia ramosa]|uniref:hypothetical protein n=1 Tax=Nevskia ramosa TaxID=64002 RepID=UPI0012EB561D|nr:hypothetical protein [Nevskia ramosa]
MVRARTKPASAAPFLQLLLTSLLSLSFGSVAVAQEPVPVVSIPASSEAPAAAQESEPVIRVIAVPPSAQPLIHEPAPRTAPEQVIEQLPGQVTEQQPAPIQPPLLEASPVPAAEAPAAPAIAQEPAPLANQATKLPLLMFKSPLALRFSVYQRLAEAEQLADAQAVPMSGRVNLYLDASGLNRVNIASLSIRIDEQTLFDRALLAAETAALAERRDPLRLVRSSLSSGVHRVQATVTLMADAKGESAQLNIDQNLELASAGSDLELRIESGTLGKPGLVFRRLQRDESRKTSVISGSLEALGVNVGVVRYPPGADNDPAVGHARTLGRMGQAANGLVALLADAVQAGPNGHFEPPYWLAQAALLRELGVLDRAQAICDQLDAAKVAGAAVATERLLIAEARYSAGDYSAAEAQLVLSKRRLPEYRQADWRNVSGLIELARLRPGEARDTLKVADSESIEAFRYMAASTEALRATGYGRYNLAIAMIRSGDAARGRSWLDLLGRTASTDPELLELRDRANLSLGWQFLREKQGRTALGVLGRVRSDGLSSNRALLGMGWAQLAPDGERLPRVTLRTENLRVPDQIGDLSAPIRNSLERLRVLEPEISGGWAGPSSFERDDPPKNRNDGLRRAITVWSALLGRDERDPSVIEAKLAIAHAQDQLRDIGAARTSYADTLTSLRNTDAAIERDAAFVKAGDLVASLSAIDLADDAALYGLMDRLRLEPGNDTSALYAAIGDQREYRQLAVSLQASSARLAALPASEASAALLAKLELASRQIALVQHDAEVLVGQRALLQLQSHRKMVGDYMKTALLLAARAEDTPAIELRNSETAPTP